MSTNIPIEDWSIRFAHKLAELGAKAELADLVLMAQEMYPVRASVEPEIAAQAEFEAWPPHDD